MNQVCRFLTVTVLATGITPAGFCEEAFQMGMAGEVLIPVNESFGEFYSTGFGVSLRAQYSLLPLMAIMVTAGYLTFPSAPPSAVAVDDALMIPLLAGAKFIVLNGAFRLYGAFDIGMTSFDRTEWVPGNLTVEEKSSIEFTWQPHIGIEADIGKNTSFEIAGRYIGLTGAESVGIRAGILFGL